jgi:polyphosphate kinase 2 (PPK2 family)
MSTKETVKRARGFSKPFQVTDGSDFRLKEIDPGDTLGLGSEDKPRAREALATGVAALAELQDMLYAQDRWAVLLIFQAMDAAGKDGTIKHVMSGVNPQGCQVYSFKTPSFEELDHDFLWRCMKYVPERGRIGIFNRSYYEETLVVRVHPEFLEKQTLPPELVKGEQKRRFLERLENPEKNWKFSANDVKERAFWGDYMTAYEDMIRRTATPDAPWYVVPTDNKWFTRTVVAAAVIETLDALNLHYPKISNEKLKELAVAKQMLIGSKE